MRSMTAPEAVPRLAVSLLGPFRAHCAGREIRLRSRKARAVLGYLLLSDGGEETRERLVGLLWSESDEDRARASLRQELHTLREHLGAAGFDGFRSDKLSLGLRPDAAETDLHQLLRAVEAGEVPALLLDTPDLGEMLLQGLDDLDPAFRVWLRTTRQGLLDRLTRTLEPAMRRADREPARRQALARAMLRLDPTHEEACRILMRSLAEAGDTAGALRAYEVLYQLLGEEFDTEPTSATQRLVAEIKLGRLEPPARAASAAPPAPEEPAGPAARIALLVEPFQTNGVPPEQQHLTEGFRHDLMASLVRFREWFVVDGTALPPPEQTGHRVSARYRIRTTAYRAGEGIQVNLTLADESGVWLWSESTDLRLAHWYEMQQRIVRRIAVSLNLQVSSARLSRLSAVPDLSLDGFDRWLRAQAMILRFNAADWDRAAQLFTECIERDPDFSPAWSGLAQMDNAEHIVHPGRRRNHERATRGLERARRAVALDPMDSRAQLSLGWSQAMLGRHAQADVHMRLACDLNGNDSWTLISAALFYAFRAQHRRAAALAERSLASTLVPSATHWAYQVSIAFLRGDMAATLHACDMANDVIRTLPAWRAAAHARLGEAEPARAAAQRFLRGIRGFWPQQPPPDDETVVAWLLHLYPFEHERDWRQLRDGLAAAGLPVQGVRYAP